MTTPASGRPSWTRLASTCSQTTVQGGWASCFVFTSLSKTTSKSEFSLLTFTWSYTTRPGSNIELVDLVYETGTRNQKSVNHWWPPCTSSCPCWKNASSSCSLTTLLTLSSYRNRSLKSSMPSSRYSLVCSAKSLFIFNSPSLTHILISGDTGVNDWFLVSFHSTTFLWSSSTDRTWQSGWKSWRR